MSRRVVVAMLVVDVVKGALCPATTPVSGAGCAGVGKWRARGLLPNLDPAKNVPEAALSQRPPPRTRR